MARCLYNPWMSGRPLEANVRLVGVDNETLVLVDNVGFRPRTYAVSRRGAERDLQATDFLD
ncbi:MAG TPA: hypothetical protein VFA18_24455, partial [Gemmataceae bacterium]|nr:hypothetical protein [Gemmataceae bacterium]